MNMSPGKKRALLVIGGILAALAVALAAVVLFIDLDRYKPRLEAAASEALGLEVRIRGNVHLLLFPPIGVAADGLKVARDGNDVLRTERVRVDLNVLPLLLGRIRLRNVEVTRPVLSLRRTSRGPFDFERYLYRPVRYARNALPGTFDRIGRVSVSEGMISYSGRDPAFLVRGEGLDLTIRDIAFQGPPVEELFRNISFTGTVTATGAAIGNTEFSGISFPISASNGNFEISPIAFTAMGGTGGGSVWINLSASIPLVQVRYSLSGADIGRPGESSGRMEDIPGRMMDLSADLFMKGREPDSLARTVTGDISATGRNLALPVLDLDALLSVSGTRNDLPLPQTMALLLSPLPFTPAVGDLSASDNAAGATQGERPIGTLISTWTVKDGMFEAKDVAFSTKEHRIALTGRIDLPGKRFVDITLAPVDDKGCARAVWAVQGPFGHPRITGEQPPMEITPPRKTPAGQQAEPVSEQGCRKFYAGSVPPPE